MIAVIVLLGLGIPSPTLCCLMFINERISAGHLCVPGLQILPTGRLNTALLPVVRVPSTISQVCFRAPGRLWVYEGRGS